MRGNVVRVATNPETDFTGALVTSELATLDLLLPMAIAGGGHCRSILRHIVVSSVEQRAWEIAIFSRRSFQTTPVGQSAFLGSFQFAMAAGKQYGSGPYFYQAQNVDIPYADLDFEDQELPLDTRGNHLHLMLVNRSPDPKSVGEAGAIEIVCFLEPTYG